MTNAPDPPSGHDQAREVARLEAEYAFDPAAHAYELANALSGLAITRDVAGDKAEALAHFARAVTVARGAYQGATPASGDIHAHEHFLTHVFNYVQYCLWDGDAADALACADEALALLDDVATRAGKETAGSEKADSEKADDASATAGRALYLDFRAEALSKLGRNAESLEAHSEAALMLALSHDAYPEQVEFLERHVANRMAKVIENEGPNPVHKPGPGT
jgi:tetratricopeptide (TPR) repeat protein